MSFLFHPILSQLINTLRLLILLPFSNRAEKPSLNHHFLLCFPSFYFFFLLISPFFPAKKSKKIESHFSPCSWETSSFFPSRKHPLIECFLILQAELIYWAIVDKQYIGQHREGKKYNKYKQNKIVKENEVVDEESEVSEWRTSRWWRSWKIQIYSSRILWISIILKSSVLKLQILLQKLWYFNDFSFSLLDLIIFSFHFLYNFSWYTI